MKIPTRLQPDQLKEFFYPTIAERIISDIWGKNTCIITLAKNGKHYWISYVFKDYSKQWIQVKAAKSDKDKPGFFK